MCLQPTLPAVIEFFPDFFSAAGAHPSPNWDKAAADQPPGGLPTFRFSGFPDRIPESQLP